jgi:hypothetical protein
MLCDQVGKELDVLFIASSLLLAFVVLDVYNHTVFFLNCVIRILVTTLREFLSCLIFDNIDDTWRQTLGRVVRDFEHRPVVYIEVLGVGESKTDCLPSK